MSAHDWGAAAELLSAALQERFAAFLTVARSANADPSALARYYVAVPPTVPPWALHGGALTAAFVRAHVLCVTGAHATTLGGGVAVHLELGAPSPSADAAVGSAEAARGDAAAPCGVVTATPPGEPCGRVAHVIRVVGDGALPLLLLDAALDPRPPLDAAVPVVAPRGALDSGDLSGDLEDASPLGAIVAVYRALCDRGVLTDAAESLADPASLGRRALEAVHPGAGEAAQAVLDVEVAMMQASFCFVVAFADCTAAKVHQLSESVADTFVGALPPNNSDDGPLRDRALDAVAGLAHTVVTAAIFPLLMPQWRPPFAEQDLHFLKICRGALRMPQEALGFPAGADLTAAIRIARGFDAVQSVLGVMRIARAALVAITEAAQAAGEEEIPPDLTIAGAMCVLSRASPQHFPSTIALCRTFTLQQFDASALGYSLVTFEAAHLQLPVEVAALGPGMSNPSAFALPPRRPSHTDRSLERVLRTPTAMRLPLRHRPPALAGRLHEANPAPVAAALPSCDVCPFRPPLLPTGPPEGRGPGRQDSAAVTPLLRDSGPKRFVGRSGSQAPQAQPTAPRARPSSGPAQLRLTPLHHTVHDAMPALQDHFQELQDAAERRALEAHRDRRVLSWRSLADRCVATGARGDPSRARSPRPVRPSRRRRELPDATSPVAALWRWAIGRAVLLVRERCGSFADAAAAEMTRRREDKARREHAARHAQHLTAALALHKEIVTRLRPGRHRALPVSEERFVELRRLYGALSDGGTVSLEFLQRLLHERGLRVDSTAVRRLDRDFTGRLDLAEVVHGLYPATSQRTLRALMHKTEGRVAGARPNPLDARGPLTPEAQGTALELFRLCDRHRRGVLCQADLEAIVPTAEWRRTLGIDALFPTPTSCLSLSQFTDLLKYGLPPYAGNDKESLREAVARDVHRLQIPQEVFDVQNMQTSSL